MMIFCWQPDLRAVSAEKQGISAVVAATDAFVPRHAAAAKKFC
jgi:hypothetical protein